MKKIWFAGLALCGLLSLSSVGNVFACISPDGQEGESTDGVPVKNCSSGQVLVEPKDAMKFSANDIDFGYFSEIGKSYTQTFIISNNSSMPINVKLSVAKPDIDGISDDNKLAADWIVFVGGVKYFEVAAMDSKTVGVRVVVPADAKPGSQYATIGVENVTGEVSEKVNVKMAVATDGVAFGGEVVKNDAVPISFSNNAKAGLTVKNSGNAGFVAKYTVRVTPKFGLEDWKDIADESKDVYPGAEVDFSVDDKEIGFGFFTVEQKIVYVNKNGEQVEETSKRTILNIPVWMLFVIGGIVLLAIIITVIVRIVKKKKDEGEDFEEEETKEKKEKKKKKTKKAKAKKDDSGADAVDMKV